MQYKEHGTISTKNVRDASQITHLAKQSYPNNAKFFSASLSTGQQRTLFVLFVDLTPACPDEIWIGSGIFPTDTNYVYQSGFCAGYFFF